MLENGVLGFTYISHFLNSKKYLVFSLISLIDVKNIKLKKLMYWSVLSISNSASLLLEIEHKLKILEGLILFNICFITLKFIFFILKILTLSNLFFFEFNVIPKTL